ncbi:MAG: squalene/phytoene synthase family protein [Hyphomicrobiaceae bacterium]
MPPGAANRPSLALDATVLAVARDHARDLYLAALISPAQARADLIALAAFEGEIARIPDLVSEPLLGEIRLRWWRDALCDPKLEDPTGNPVADHAIDVVRRYGLSREGLAGSLDARIADLGLEPISDMAALGRYVEAVDGEAARRRAALLGVPEDAADFMQAAARAVGFGRFVRLHDEAGPGLDRRQIAAQARQDLADARRLARTASRAALLAVLPVALVEPQLRASEGLSVAGSADREIARPAVTPLGRVVRLWWAARTGRF